MSAGAAGPGAEAALSPCTLAGPHPGHEVELVPLGAHLVAVRVPDAAGRLASVVLAHADRHRYLQASSPYLGALVGRWAGRIAGARFPLDGRVVEVAANEGGTCLHGGPDGFHRRVWDVEVVTHEHGATAHLGLVSPDGDQGFPGTLRVVGTLGWRAEPTGGTLALRLQATTDAPTVVSLTAHPYWNLAGAGTVEDHHLQVRASRWLPTDHRLIPAGGPADVGGTPVDLRRGARLGDAIARPEVAGTGGLDHCLLLDEPSVAPGAPPVAVLEHPASGRRLELWTDQPALQVYTAGGLGGADGLLRHGGGVPRAPAAARRPQPARARALGAPAR